MTALLSELWALRAGSLASSGIGPCDVLFKYASDPIPCGYPVARPPRLARMAGRHSHLHGLGTPIREISGLEFMIHFSLTEGKKMLTFPTG